MVDKSSWPELAERAGWTELFYELGELIGRPPGGGKLRFVPWEPHLLRVLSEASKLTESASPSTVASGK